VPAAAPLHRYHVLRNTAIERVGTGKESLDDQRKKDRERTIFRFVIYRFFHIIYSPLTSSSSTSPPTAAKATTTGF
jgi:hypothetical protein